MFKTNEEDYKKIEYIALYGRVASGNTEVSNREIAAQKATLVHWAEQQGYSPEQPVILVDDGFSGLILDRPGIQQFFSGKRNYAMLVAVDFSRFARDVFLIDRLVDDAEAQGTTVYALKEQTSFNQWKRERDQFFSTLLKGGAGK